MKTARDIMTSDVISVTPDTPVEELARIFVDHNISGVPVIDSDGNVSGIATESDLIFQNKQPKVPAFITILDSFVFLDSPEQMDKELKKIAGATVEEIASSPVVSIGPDTPLDEIATLMIEKRMHTLPVLSETGEMLGIVGKRDIIKTIL